MCNLLSPLKRLKGCTFLFFYLGSSNSGFSLLVFDNLLFAEDRVLSRKKDAFVCLFAIIFFEIIDNIPSFIIKYDKSSETFFETIPGIRIELAVTQTKKIFPSSRPTFLENFPDITILTFVSRFNYSLAILYV